MDIYNFKSGFDFEHNFPNDDVYEIKVPTFWEAVHTINLGLACK